MVKKEAKKEVPAFLSKFMKTMECAVLASDIAKQSSEGNFLEFDDPYLNWATGKGMPVGRITVFAGRSGTGKTFLMAWAIGKLQRQNPDAWAVIMDIEYFYKDRPDRVKRLLKFGVDLDRLLIVSSNQPDVVFSRLGEIEAALKRQEFSLCALGADSLGGMEDMDTATKIDEGNISAAGNKVGGNAKMITQLVKRLLRIGAEHNCSVLLVQHAIEDIAAAAKSGGKGGVKWIVTGGQKLRLLSDLMLLTDNVERKDALVAAGGVSVEYEDKDVVAVGKTVRYLVLKTRDGMEGKKAEVKFDFENCVVVQKEESLFNLAKLLGIIAHPVNAEGKENVMWWAVKGDASQKWQGEKQIVKALEDKKLYDKVYRACMAVEHAPTYAPVGETLDISVELGVLD